MTIMMSASQRLLWEFSRYACNLLNNTIFGHVQRHILVNPSFFCSSVMHPCETYHNHGIATLIEFKIDLDKC